jgi:hypothetical protein
MAGPASASVSFNAPSRPARARSTSGRSRESASRVGGSRAFSTSLSSTLSALPDSMSAPSGRGGASSAPGVTSMNRIPTSDS